MTDNGRRVPPPRHWWSAMRPPGSEPISVRRAYLEVLLVFGAFFGAGILAAGFSLGSRLPTQSGGWGLFGPAAFEELAQAGMAATLVVLLARSRGISIRGLGLDFPRRADGTLAAGQTLRIATWAVTAFIVGSIVTSAVATGKYATPPDLNAAFLVYSSTASLNAGIVEELVVLGFVMVTLQQARRPLWEIVLVGLVLRGSYHIYYGPGVVGILVWGAVFLWLFLRTRSLLPIVVVHFAWDLTVFLAQRWPAMIVIALLVVLAMVVASPITWLVERANLRITAASTATYPTAGSTVPYLTAPYPTVPYPAAPPGWRPDPWGQHRWRWWDGVRWTDTTA